MELTGLFANRSPEPFSQVIGDVATEALSEEAFESATTTSHSPALYQRQHLSDVQVDQLVEAYQAGATAKDLGESFGIHRTRVSSILKDRGIALRNQRLAPKDIELAIELYQSGLSLAKVGQRVSRDPNSVRLLLKKHGVSRRDTHGQAQ